MARKEVFFMNTASLSGKREENIPLSGDGFRTGKAQARKRLLDLRGALAPEEVLRRSALIQDLVLADPLWKAARAVALYVAARGEVSTEKLLDAAWAEGKKVFLPRCLRRDPAEPREAGGRMVFALCRSRDELALGGFGLFEPLETCPALSPFAADPDPAALPELVIVPVIGVRADGARLGFGGGYYDRAFARPVWSAVRRLALAYGFQRADFPALKAGEGKGRDICMHGYATEEGLVWL